MIFHFFFIIIVLFRIKECTILTGTFKIDYNRPHFSCYIGDPVQPITIEFNQDKQYSLIPRNKFQLNVSSTIKQYNTVIIAQDDQVFDADEYSDCLKFFMKSTKFYDFTFFVPKDNIYNQENENKTKWKNYGVSLAYQFLEDKFSLLRHLKVNEVIDQMIYGLRMTSDSFGLLLLGGVPDHIKKENNRVVKCKADNSYITWGCSLIDIAYIDENNKQVLPAFKVDSYASFRINKGKVSVTKEFMNHIASSILSSEFKNNKCHFVTKGKLLDKKYVNCQNYSEFIVKLSKLKISLHFNNIELHIPFQYLFNCSKDWCESLFKDNQMENIKKQDLWIIGRPILRNFLTLYNYEDGTVSFLDKKDVFNVTDSKIYEQDELFNSKNNIKILYSICSILLIIINIYIIFQKYLGNKL